MADVIERLSAATVVDDDGCWLSSIGLSSGGYSQVNVTLSPGQYRLRMAHVVSWERFAGVEKPAGMDIDRLCRKRNCWNPLHLELVTHAENVRRGSGAAFHRDKTHCPKRHEYTPENTRVRPQSMGRSGFRRECRECARLREQERRMRGQQ